MALTIDNTCWKFTDNREWREHFKNWPPAIISCAITGGVHGKAANPNLPETPEEQADSTYEAYKAGAAIVHIHARDPNMNYATNSSNGEDFYKANHLIRERCPDLIINNTCSGLFNEDDQEVMNRFFAGCNPEVASLDVGMLYMRMKIKSPFPLDNPDESVVEMFKQRGLTILDKKTLQYEGVNMLGYTKTEKFARAMKASNIKPELEVFNSQSWWFVDNLINQNLLEPPYWCQLVFGQDGACSPPTVMSALDMIANMPPNSMFSAIGTGVLELPIITLSLIMGGHIRVGLEDNVYYKRGQLAKSNAELVERAVRLVHELNREVATPAQAREMLGLSQTPKQYP
ncbi:MAG: 3-keto-5-aminohexanoate cleavage protein [Candidatus Abyssobacteria bacterium SURF_5]|uniref:3-keto-5-aminohexanoate cleavage protein n=1 Tax=Abyssobacteria bacterium (strain SURF_5) TaxID=2093360 RepID=A0A3A4NEC7_ABYX5|nr:MAG: 3-keto-5-aminohexanoate cleavage protein [Candidatus Abyssubacteria bacterium SURF_5]